jgi:hypothetical protein
MGYGSVPGRICPGSVVASSGNGCLESTECSRPRIVSGLEDHWVELVRSEHCIGIFRTDPFAVVSVDGLSITQSASFAIRFESQSRRWCNLLKEFMCLHAHTVCSPSFT